jgi:hypothetical protein
MAWAVSISMYARAEMLLGGRRVLSILAVSRRLRMEEGVNEEVYLHKPRLQVGEHSH